jgi:Fic family protein
MTVISCTNTLYDDLKPLPPKQESVETIKILRQVNKSAIALAELKGLVHILPNPQILLNAVILKEVRVSSEIENVITTQDKLYQALSAKGPVKKKYKQHINLFHNSITIRPHA